MKRNRFSHEARVSDVPQFRMWVSFLFHVLIRSARNPLLFKSANLSHDPRTRTQIVENVRASIGDVKGSLLLGQSFLEKFKSWSMDNTNHELVLE